ncbi:MAG: head-tail connector protein [Allorhizobium sp.]
MTYAVITPPSAEPLTLVEVKAHLRLDTGDEDALLASLIVTAREYLERQAGLCLMTQTLRLYRDQWPADGVIQILRGPVQAIENVTVFSSDGVPGQVSLEDHLLDGQSRPARLWLRHPKAPGQAINGIEIDFVAGFGATGAEVPNTLRRAVLMHVALMFAYRGAVAATDQPAAIPAGYDRLVAPYAQRRL